jgi:hypothetical protein
MLSNYKLTIQEQSGTVKQVIVKSLRIDTVNGMSKTSKNHPQTMAHHNLFNNATGYRTLRNKTQDNHDRHLVP